MNWKVFLVKLRYKKVVGTSKVPATLFAYYRSYKICE